MVCSLLLNHSAWTSADDDTERLKAIYDPPYLAYYTDKTEFDDAADLVTEHFDDYGPFDGVLAFSQGCHLATALMTATSHDDPNSQPFRFAVFMGAGLSPKFDVKDGECQRQLHVPILHVIGRKDGYRHQSREYTALHDKTSDMAVLEHDGGHHVPTDVVTRYAITRYIRNRCSEWPAAA
jgi:predicted esterase